MKKRRRAYRKKGEMDYCIFETDRKSGPGVLVRMYRNRKRVFYAWFSDGSFPAGRADSLYAARVARDNALKIIDETFSERMGGDGRRP